MAAFLLHEAETLVARALEQGELCDLGASPNSVVRGDAVARILLGAPVCLDGEAEETRIRPHPKGARVRRASVAGPLILDDVAALDGGEFPPLDFQECTFSGVVSLCRARLRHLSLAGSRLSHLRGIAITVNGAVDLSGISSAETGATTTGAAGRGVCWVELQEGRIQGCLVAAGARLVAPAEREGLFIGGRAARYALDLGAAMIGNELALMPDFEAYGGVNIRSARIDKDVLAHGAVLTGVEGFALTAAGARIGGLALFNPAFLSKAEPAVRFTAAGGVSFVDLAVEGTVELRGAKVGYLDATNAHIGGGALLGVWESGDVSIPFESLDGISINLARIAGALDLAGASVKKVIAQNVYVGGPALLRAYNCKNKTIPCVIEGELYMSGARVTGDLDLSGTRLLGVNVQNGEIGDSLFLSSWIGPTENLRFSASGSLFLAGLKITGNLNANGASMGRLSADNAHIGGAAFLGAWQVIRSTAGTSDAVSRPDQTWPFEVMDEMSLMGCTITGNLEMSGASVSRLLASNAKVGGAVFLSAYEREGVTWRFEGKEMVSLVGIRIGGNLEMTGATVRNLDAQNADIGGSVSRLSTNRPSLVSSPE